MSVRDTTYDRYIRDIGNYPRITHERELALTKIIATSKKEEYIEAAIDELVKSNLRLVVHCVKSFSSFLSCSSASITAMDLIAEGNLALVKAAKNFNPSYQTEEHVEPIHFSAYACKCIKNSMRKAFRKAKFIHIPDHHYGYWKKIKDLREQYSEGLDDSIMMEKLDVGASRLKTLKLGMDSATIMLEDFTNEDGESNWNDIIADESAINPQEQIASKDLREYLLSNMHALPPRTRDMISMMFFDDHRPTLNDLSRRFGVSKERCRQVCARGLQHLKVHMKRVMDTCEHADLFNAMENDLSVENELLSQAIAN